MGADGGPSPNIKKGNTDMNAKTLSHAISEADRFLKLAKKAKDTVEDYPSKITAAAKRASMDLARALS